MTGPAFAEPLLHQAAPRTARRVPLSQALGFLSLFVSLGVVVLRGQLLPEPIVALARQPPGTWKTMSLRPLRSTVSAIRATSDKHSSLPHKSAMLSEFDSKDAYVARAIDSSQLLKGRREVAGAALLAAALQVQLPMISFAAETPQKDEVQIQKNKAVWKEGLAALNGEKSEGPYAGLTAWDVLVSEVNSANEQYERDKEAKQK
eukprot:gnl/TRDRNA2_/TRDRNA2_151545_c0_seq1.p1 gnl/TRDRNA2_/TRDRNA2_151545_c0~~gnl/TRDRNA2_/TRDRNA2_151545_c0_seq1.p1  ORF type:complete len:204 (-),score=43.19 gnl/TRDRNA2_/TRDRNA2_151545_c0_seq1:174-785(-)